jgi:hypothetical protein
MEEDILKNTILRQSKSEWFELRRPIGEPDIKWNESEPYYIERREVDGLY